MSHNSHTKLLIAGYSLGDECERLKARVASLGIRNVDFVGFKKGEELRDLFHGARCVVVPSLWYENTPNVVLEAMSYGKPVVASSREGIAELIDDGKDGFLFEPGDSEALRSRLEMLLADDVLACETGRAARRKVETQYTPAIHYERLMALFRRATNR